MRGGLHFGEGNVSQKYSATQVASGKDLYKFKLKRKEEPPKNAFSSGNNLTKTSAAENYGFRRINKWFWVKACGTCSDSKF